MQTHLSDFQTFLEVERDASPHTIRNYLSDLQQFFTFVNAHRSDDLPNPEQIDITDIRAFLQQQHQQGAQYTTMARKLASLRSFLDCFSLADQFRICQVFDMFLPETGLGNGAITHVIKQ